MTIAITTPPATSPMIKPLLTSTRRRPVRRRCQAVDHEHGEQDHRRGEPGRRADDEEALDDHPDGPDVREHASEAAAAEQRDACAERKQGEAEVPDPPDPEMLTEHRVGELVDLGAVAEVVDRRDDSYE